MELKLKNRLTQRVSPFSDYPLVGGMRKLIWGVIVSLILSGCASSVQKKLDAYNGQDIEVAQKGLGYNYSTRPLKNGKTAYTWVNHYITDKCEFTLITDTNGKVLENRFRDNSGGATCSLYID